MSGNADEIASDEKVVEIELERLHPFRGHPFKVRDDPQMLNLIDSISKYGVLNPLIVRPVPEGWYEIISGHRRKYAAQKLGYRKLPVIIRVLKDDEAVISMIDSNLHREVLLPSEKAFALKMKYDAIKRRSGRRKSGQVDHEKDRKKTVEVMGEEAGESSKQIQRYLKVTELIPDLLDMLGGSPSRYAFHQGIALPLPGSADEETQPGGKAGSGGNEGHPRRGQKRRGQARNVQK